MERGRIDLIRPNGLVERLDRLPPMPPPAYRRPPGMPDRRRGGRWPEAFWRGRLLDLVS